MSLPTVLTLFGPTASGKTGASIALAKALNGEIINADSRQVYQHMPVITAAPSDEEKGDIPHHLFEFLSPAERMSAARWSELALTHIEDILARGKLPIVVGGTGLYLRTLIEGLSEIPATPLEVEQQFHGTPSQQLHKQLEKVDPVLAAKLHPSDTQRITRALVVFTHTGKPLSEWQAIPPKAPPYNFIRLALSPEREELYARINRRWGLMEQAGVLQEVAALKDAGYTLDMPGMQGLGIPEIFDYIDGLISWSEVAHTVTQGTRHYAKRQVTWLRNTFASPHEFTSPASLVENIIKTLA
ncbi:MAG: tRNA (adenosine(37)-N6)-dimethylallyltransferase MiaA [Pseudomonas fluorescens]|nr:MAG: tRNA (adenosine(37)-N6)-dimethylallyltransferase MiaA [Pseudomonas fluorescens]